MTVTLSDEVSALIQERIDSGEFDNAEALIATAVCEMPAADFGNFEPEELQRLADVGLADIAAGRVLTEEQFFARLAEWREARRLQSAA